MNKLLYLSLLLLAFNACSSKKYTRETIPQNYIEFGYMDAKTSGTSTYILADNGQIFMKSTITSRYSEYKKLKEKDAEFVYTMVDQLRMSNNTMYQIGEKTHFIRLRQGKEMYEWKWDPTDENLPANIKKLDELLTEAMQKRLD